MLNHGSICSSASGVGRDCDPAAPQEIGEVILDAREPRSNFYET